MGMNISDSGIADSLFTSVQQRVLGILFGQPDRSFQGAELIRLARSGTGAVHRELMRLTSSGLISMSKVGNQKFYRANRESPVFHDLHGLVIRTVGLRGPIADALRGFEKQIRAAFVYGSFAKGKETARSDVDLMVIAKGVEYPELYGALEGPQSLLHRTINPHLMTPADWKRKLARENAFVTKVKAQPKLFIVGSEDVIA